MTDPRQILKSAKTILLVDWPNPGVPRALLAAGFTVFSFSPERYSEAIVLIEQPHGTDAKDLFPPTKEGETGYLVFRRLSGPPAAVDIVTVYRPVEELAGIVTKLVLPLRAKVVWLQPPVTPARALVAHRIAKEHALVCIEGADIAEIARLIDGGA